MESFSYLLFPFISSCPCEGSKAGANFASLQITGMNPSEVTDPRSDSKLTTKPYNNPSRSKAPRNIFITFVADIIYHLNTDLYESPKHCIYQVNQHSDANRYLTYIPYFLCTWKWGLEHLST